MPILFVVILVLSRFNSATGEVHTSLTCYCNDVYEDMADLIRLEGTASARDVFANLTCNAPGTCSIATDDCKVGTKCRKGLASAVGAAEEEIKVYPVCIKSILPNGAITQGCAYEYNKHEDEDSFDCIRLGCTTFNFLGIPCSEHQWHRFPFVDIMWSYACHNDRCNDVGFHIGCRSLGKSEQDKETLFAGPKEVEPVSSPVRQRRHLAN